MTNFSEMNVRTKLIAGFGILISLLFIIIITAAVELNSVGSQSDKIINKDFTKSMSVAKINELSRSNAANTLQLLVLADKTERDKIHDNITANGEKIASNFDTLEKLVYTPTGKEILRKIKERRAAYRESYLNVSKLVEDDKKDDALKLFRSETSPRLAEMMESIEEFEDQQVKLVGASSIEISHDITAANFTMLALGVIASIVAVGAAFLITKSLLKQLGGEPIYAVAIAEKISQGDLTVHIETANDDASSLLYAMKKMRDSISAIVGQVRVATETIITSSTEISNGNLELSSRTEQQASSLEETAASMEELNQTVKQNADNARQANKLAQTASDVATKGGEGVAQVVATMEDINASSRKIVDIISVIDGIAFQTNILALNAAVEAARAGEQGRGFAVVASEVRNLAQRSAAAAKEIKELISNSVEKVEGGTRLVGSTADTMAEVVNSIRQVNDIVSEITSASQEQSQGISQVNDAVIQMDDVTQQNAALVEQSAAASQAMQEQAHKLAELVSIFKLAQDGQSKRGADSTRPTSIKSKSPATKRIESNGKPKMVPKAGGSTSSERKVNAETDKDWEEF